ncbi:hypothetical protein, partial [Xanthomonas oryzae]|uniref:hypothetical protein n=1 Tax=Xanthomonas oryzae TaxID=347 RepID=UPI00095D2F0E
MLEARCIAAPADIAIGCSLRQSFDLGVADSTLIRNAVEDLLGEDFEGRFESKYLARTIVEPRLDPSQVRIGDGADIGQFMFTVY